ncbi:MAG: HIT family protein [Candidatus Limnocylindria bacterium]
MRRWPDDWAERKAGRDCPMCASGFPDDDAYGVRVFRGEAADAYLQKRDSGQWGYTIVIWRGRHVAEVTELSDAEAAAYWRDVRRVAAAVERRFRPAKLNIALLGNQVTHLHAHVVPRYLDDGAPGRPPRTWSSDVARPPVPEAQLGRDAAALRRLLEPAAVDPRTPRSSSE